MKQPMRSVIHLCSGCCGLLIKAQSYQTQIRESGANSSNAGPYYRTAAGVENNRASAFINGRLRYTNFHALLWQRQSAATVEMFTSGI